MKIELITTSGERITGTGAKLSNVRHSQIIAEEKMAEAYLNMSTVLGGYEGAGTTRADWEALHKMKTKNKAKLAEMRNAVAGYILRPDNPLDIAQGRTPRPRPVQSIAPVEPVGITAAIAEIQRRNAPANLVLTCQQCGAVEIYAAAQFPDGPGMLALPIHKIGKRGEELELNETLSEADTCPGSQKLGNLTIDNESVN